MTRIQLRRHAELLRLLGHPTRLALLSGLLQGTKCVTDIQELLDVRQAYASQHLSALRRAGFVDCCEQGKLRCYYLTRPRLIRQLLKFLQGRYPRTQPTSSGIRQAAMRRRS